VLLLGAFYGLTHAINAEPGTNWARLGWGVVIIGVGLGVCFMATEIVAVPQAASIWAASTGEEKDLALATGSAIVQLSLTLSTAAALFLFGIGPVLYGVALVASHSYPSWVGWAGWSSARAVPAQPLRVPDDVILSLALHVLARAQIVAFDGVGIAGEVLPETNAYFVVLDAGGAARPEVERLFQTATVAGKVYAAWLLECLDPDAAAVAWAELRDTPEAFRACFGCRMSSGMTTARYLDEYAPPLRELWNGPVRGPRPW